MYLRVFFSFKFCLPAGAAMQPCMATMMEPTTIVLTAPSQRRSWYQPNPAKLDSHATTVGAAVGVEQYLR